ncbi:hypothetical protein MNV49_007473 [Pseudohyphozyma bogoriensis]|nr:hypothetical protein MNV49_007473 [Pseudohyphozyma bogoriensis]
MLLATLLTAALPTLSLALPSQFVISDPTSAASSTKLPALNASHFPGHVLIPLNDGNFVPSPAFGAGTAWHGQDPEDTLEALVSALKVGYRHLDNSAIYYNEEVVGKAIKQSGIPREELYITTKFDNLDGEDVETEFQKSLDKLGVTYVDLYLIHFPQFAQPSLSAVWKTFESLVSRKLVRSIGISNYNAAQLAELLLIARIPPAVNQIRYHPYNTIEQKPVVELAKKEGIVIAAYSALTPLTKEESRGGPIDEVLKEVVEEQDITEGQVILSWVKQKGILDVTTSGKEWRQKEQLDVFAEDFPELSKEEIKKLDKAGIKGELKGF